MIKIIFNIYEMNKISIMIISKNLINNFKIEKL